MWSAVACDALRDGKRLRLQYDGYERVVEVHCVGESGERHELMRVWQVRGGSRGGQQVGWKLLRLDEARFAEITDEDAEAPRAGFNPVDPAMSVVLCSL